MSKYPLWAGPAFGLVGAAVFLSFGAFLPDLILIGLGIFLVTVSYGILIVSGYVASAIWGFDVRIDIW